MTILLLPGLAAVALALLFALSFRQARRWNNYGIVDVVWAFSFGALALLYATGADGWGPRRALIAAMVIIWSGRLGSYLYRRVRSHHPVEDARYEALRQRWANDFSRQMFIFFQQQALSVLILGLPFLLITANPAETFHPLEVAGAVLWLVALLGETLADAQLAAFKRSPGQQGRVCEVGLWRYSRHPNYFFEWCVWLGYFVFACASPWGWTSVICVAGIFYLLRWVTGVPMAEAQSLLSRGEAYRDYQRRVPVFVPWFPKKAKE